MLTPAYEDTSIAVQDPKVYRCAPDQYIKSFQLAAVHTDLIVGNADSQFGTTYLGSISAECSDGEQLPTVRSSEDTDSNAAATSSSWARLFQAPLCDCSFMRCRVVGKPSVELDTVLSPS